MKQTLKQKNIEQWPLKRNVFFRPDRYKYIKSENKNGKNGKCVFCEVAKAKMSIDSLCVYKSKHSMIVLNKFPYNSGHLLVIPARHEGDLLSLKTAEYSDLNDTLRVAMKALNVVYEPAAINIGMNHGRAAGAGIPEHLHYHLVPRWVGDLNFFPLIAETKVVIENLEQTYKQLLGYFKKVGRKKVK